MHQTFTPTAESVGSPRRFAIVLNAKSGALFGSDDAAENIQRAFEGEGASVRMIGPDAGTLPERIALGREMGTDLVIAGGDGTIACAAQMLAGPRLIEHLVEHDGPALGILPSGTMNLLARDLCMPVGNTEAAIQALMHGRVRAIDVGEVDGHVFTCASMLGTPVRLGRHREAGRHAGGGWRTWLNLVRAGLRAWHRRRALRLTLVCNGRRIRVRSPAVTITVNPLDDASGRRFGRSCLDGGELCIYIVRHTTRWRLLRVLAHAITAGTLRDRGIDVLRTTELVIESRQRALHVLVDGEMRLLEPPLHYRIRPRALRVIVPA